VGDGRSTKFWHDVWQTTSHLRVNFHKIFSICEEPNMSVAKGAELQWQMGFRGVFGDDEMEEWTQLQALVEGAIIGGERDTILWGLSPWKKSTTSSLYKFLTSGGVSCRMAKKVWKCKIPLKIKVFVWKVLQDRVQTAQQLKNRMWKGSEFCSVCGKCEYLDHMLFKCPLAVFLWVFVSEALGWQGYPRSMEDLLSNWLNGKFRVSYQLGLSCFTGLAWTI
jgi:hypothetical protein